MSFTLWLILLTMLAIFITWALCRYARSTPYELVCPEEYGVRHRADRDVEEDDQFWSTQRVLFLVPIFTTTVNVGQLRQRVTTKQRLTSIRHIAKKKSPAFAGLFLHLTQWFDYC